MTTTVIDRKMTAAQSYRKILESAEKIQNDATQRFPEAASIGDTVRQGDIYITLLESIPKDCMPADKVSQLAPGTTQGSRHILDQVHHVDFFKMKKPSVLDGPILKVNKECTITHPEHGDWILNEGSVYKITYQRMFADELKRQMD